MPEKNAFSGIRLGIRLVVVLSIFRLLQKEFQSQLRRIIANSNYPPERSEGSIDNRQAGWDSSAKRQFERLVLEKDCWRGPGEKQDKCANERYVSPQEPDKVNRLSPLPPQEKKTPPISTGGVNFIQL